MATRLKTVEYWFPMNQSITDVTDTNLTQITVYLPESSISFKKVLLEVVVHDRNTTLGNISRHQCSIQLGAAGYTSVNNANAITNGGEQQTIQYSGDFTSYFTTNWSGTSMTCDARVLLDSAVASPLNPAFNNVSAKLLITYEYDGTSSTHVKTVRIPLDLPVSTLATSKPGTANATIPALDTELPEGSKVYRQRVLVLQGNDNGASTDLTFNMQVESGTAFASGAYEHGSNCAMFVRMNFIESEFDTSITRGFYAWANANGNHMQAWLVVTYEFDATSSNDVYVSLILPISMDSPMGGTTSSDYQRATRLVMIPEANIVVKQQAAYMFWDQLGAISSLQWRIGTGSFVTYTDAAAVLAGSNACMIRNDSAFSLAHGRNTINVDNYRSDTTDLGYNVCGFFIINYTGDKPSGGHGAETHTIIWPLSDTGTAAVATNYTISATAVTIPETDYFISGLGTECAYVPSGTVAQAGNSVQVERLSGEGGIIWEPVYADLAGTDGETGVFHSYSQARDIFKRYPDDADPNRIDLETSRRWRWSIGQSVSGRGQLSVLLTYSAMTWTVSGSVSGSSGGTVTLDLFRYDTTALSERVKTTTRVGDGSYSFTWYNDTDNLFVAATEGSTRLGRSETSTAV
jgi:hypothetical protein